MIPCDSRDVGECPEPAKWEWTLDTSHYAPLLGPNDLASLPVKLNFCDNCHGRRIDYQSSCWTSIQLGLE